MNRNNNEGINRSYRNVADYMVEYFLSHRAIRETNEQNNNYANNNSDNNTVGNNNEDINISNLNTAEPFNYTSRTCFNVMSGENINLSSPDYVKFFIMKDNETGIKHIGCYDQDSLNEYKTHIYYKCADRITRSVLYLSNDDYIKKPLVKLDFAIGSYYVYLNEFKKVEAGSKYALVATNNKIGRIVSKAFLDSNNAVSAEHCGSNYHDPIYQILKIREVAGGKRRKTRVKHYRKRKATCRN